MFDLIIESNHDIWINAFAESTELFSVRLHIDVLPKIGQILFTRRSIVCTYLGLSAYHRDVEVFPS